MSILDIVGTATATKAINTAIQDAAASFAKYGATTSRWGKASDAQEAAIGGFDLGLERAGMECR